jgi:aspartate aminotransferase-like enzyme
MVPENLLRCVPEYLLLRVERKQQDDLGAHHGDLSSIGTALHVPRERTYASLGDALATNEVEGHVFEIYSAQGKLSHELFRIFHVGEYPLEVYDVFARAPAKALG